YRGGAADLCREVRHARRAGDEKHIEAVRAANPDAGGLIDAALATNRRGVEKLVQENIEKTFTLPGLIPEEDLTLMLANVGISSRWSAIYTSNNGPHAAFLRVQLRSGFAGRHTPTIAYVEKIRDRLKQRFPTHDFFFETAGMIRRILNSG